MSGLILKKEPWWQCGDQGCKPIISHLQKEKILFDCHDVHNIILLIDMNNKILGNYI